MYLESRSDIAVLVSVLLLCIIVIGNAVNKLRKVLPYRVNCWFCNSNAWVPLPERNCWTCASCDQYNGFTKDGDYNRPLPESAAKSRPWSRSPHSSRPSPSNGLCHMCNINQQLKVAQLANFVPINEANYDKEITAYKLQLEKAYKLCSHCRKVLRAKLHKEKEALLGSKLLEKRTGKRDNNKDNRKIMKRIIKYFFVSITFTLLIAVVVECYYYSIKFRAVKTNLYLAKQMLCGFLETLTAVLKAKAFLTFPILHEYEDVSLPEYINDYYNEIMTFIKELTQKIEVAMLSDVVAQRVLVGVGCVVQVLCRLAQRNVVVHQSTVELLWLLLLLSLTPHAAPAPLSLLLLRLLTSAALFLIYESVSLKPKISIYASPTVSPRKMKNLIWNKSDACPKTASDSELETDDDISLSQYGFDSSTTFSDSRSPSNLSLASRRTNSTFTDRPAQSLWSSPAQRSSSNTFSPFLNSSSSPNGYKPRPTSPKKSRFNKYQEMARYESDSDLDEGINGLNLGPSPKKFQTNGVFSVKNFESSLNFAVPIKEQRQLICPSKLGQAASWVAGGYWGSEANATLDTAASRSSSQSSGFESHASSFHRVASPLSSRAGSVCSELDRASDLHFAPLHRTLGNSVGLGLRAPVHPQVRYDGHIHIPLPLSSAHKMRNPFSQHPDMASHSEVFPPFKRTSNLIKLPHIDS